MWIESQKIKTRAKKTTLQRSFEPQGWVLLLWVHQHMQRTLVIVKIFIIAKS